jgi:hypothetical protein
MPGPGRLRSAVAKTRSVICGPGVPAARTTTYGIRKRFDAPEEVGSPPG